MASLGHGEEALAVFKEVHGSAKGAISFDEFCSAMGPIYTSSTAALRRAFDIFDADGNGSIDRDEFSSVWKSNLRRVRRVALHAIDATPARWRGDAG